MQHHSEALKQVQFSTVPIGGFFKEAANGDWYLKTTSECGMYQHFGTRYEPRFKAEETVFVE